MNTERGPESPVLEVANLTCTYGSFMAVDDVSFSVAAGEVFAVLGVNGAGKTTMIETVQGQRLSSGGSVSVLGHPVSDREAVRRHTGVMFQRSGFCNDLTVFETVSMLGRLSGRIDDAAHVLERIGISRLADSHVGQLSGGEQRRLDFAVATFGGPALLFLDEPTAGLDPIARQRLWDEVLRLRDSGTTVVLTTHYLEEAERFADRVGLMRAGRLTDVGTIDELLSQFPRHVRYRTAPVDAPRYPAAERIGAWGTFETSHIQKDLHAFLKWAEERDVQIVDLQVESGRLRDFFEPERSASDGLVADDMDHRQG